MEITQDVEIQDIARLGCCGRWVVEYEEWGPDSCVLDVEGVRVGEVDGILTCGDDFMASISGVVMLLVDVQVG